MSSSAAQVFIQVESAAKQKENIKNQRKTLKLIQGLATDKENLTGRPQLDKLSRLKAAVHETTLTQSSEHSKRRKVEAKVAEPQTSTDGTSTSLKKITAADLCSESKPSENYYERLAEKRREALEQTLEENQRLYERINDLEEELKEVRNLVEVLTEMLNENEAEEDIEASEAAATEEQTEASDDNAEKTDDSNSYTQATN